MLSKRRNHGDIWRGKVAEYYLENNIDPESEVGRIIQENQFAEGGKINAKNYRIQELNVIRDLCKLCKIRRQRKNSRVQKSKM